MDNQAIKDLLIRYSAGKCTEEEKAWVETWYIRYKPDALPDLSPEEIERDLQEILSSLPAEGRSYWLPVWRRVAAVLFLLIVSAGIYLYLSKPAGDGDPARTSVKDDLEDDIAPGDDRALLTLGDGSTIALEDVPDGVLAKQESAVIRKTAGGRLEYQLKNKQLKEKSVAYNTLSTPRGGQYKLVLPDGSRVWLNAASSIRYPAAFTGDKRSVEVRGEAYFEITRLVAPGTGHKMPFTVNAAGMEVEVLGTRFNINAYEDESAVRATLLEGSVRVSAKKQSRDPASGGKWRAPRAGNSVHHVRVAPRGAMWRDQEPKTRTQATQNLPVGRPAYRTGRQGTKLLKPGQEASLNRATSSLDVAEVDAGRAAAWKDGFFQFHRSSLPAVMRQLSRWYDAEVSYEGEIPERAFGGKIPRDAKLSEVLKILELSDVHFRIEAPPEGPNKIIVTP